FFLFNQQILTGRSLQPFHYEEFAANYWVVLAALLCLGLRKTLSKRIIVYLAIGAFGIAVLIAVSMARLMGSTNIRFDQIRPAILALDREKSPGVVFASDGFVTNSIPK